MKKGMNYMVDHLANKVVVTRKFYEASMKWDSAEDNLMEQFKQRGFTIQIEQRKPRTEKSYADKLKAGKVPMLTYAEMKSYIVKLDDAEEMVKEFEQIRDTAKERKNRVAYLPRKREVSSSRPSYLLASPPFISSTHIKYDLLFSFSFHRVHKIFYYDLGISNDQKRRMLNELPSNLNDFATFHNDFERLTANFMVQYRYHLHERRELYAASCKGT